MEMVDPFGWHVLDGHTLFKIQGRLASLETMTWNEIFGRQHHQIPINRICRAARQRLEAIGQDDIERVVSLRLEGGKRVWGILEMGVLRLLWWDPEHQICPSMKGR